MSDICHRCGACVWGVEDGLCEDCRDDIKAQEKVEKTVKVEKADNGLTLSAKIKDILNDFEHADDIVRNIFLIPDFQKECKACKAQYKTSLLERLPKEGSIAPCKECLLEVKSLIEGDK